MTLHAKMTMPDLQLYPGNFNLIKNMEEIFVFLTQCLFLWVSLCSIVVLINKECASHFRREPTNEINSLKKQKHWYLIHTWSEKAVKGTVVNLTLPSLHGGSFEITPTVPLSKEYQKRKKLFRWCFILHPKISDKFLESKQHNNGR